MRIQNATPATGRRLDIIIGLLAVASAMVTGRNASAALEFFSNADGTGNWPTAPIDANAIGSPAMARTSSNATVLAAPQPDGSIGFYWAADGQPYWNHGDSPVAPASVGSGNPAIARSDSTSTTLVAAAGTNGSLTVYSNIDAQATWTAQTILPSGASACTPAMTRFSSAYGQGTAVVDTLANGSLYYYWQFDGGSGWNSSLIASSGSTQGCPSIVRTQSVSLVTAPGSNGALYYYYAVDTSQGIGSWTTSTVASSGFGNGLSATPAITRLASQTIIAAKPRDGSVHLYNNIDGTAGWWDQQVVAPWSTVVDPVLATTGNAWVMTVIQGSNMTPYFYWDNGTYTQGGGTYFYVGSESFGGGAFVSEPMPPAMVRTSSSTMIALSTTSIPGTVTLPVASITQSESNWCWAAVGTMIMGYEGHPITQCQQASDNALLNGKTTINCCDQSNGGGRVCNVSSSPHFDWYQFNSATMNGAISFTSGSPNLVEQMNNHTPVATIWNWTGTSKNHWLAVVGATQNVNGDNWVTVNNPDGDQEDMDYNWYVQASDHTTISTMYDIRHQ